MALARPKNSCFITVVKAKLSGQWFVLAAAALWGTTGTAQTFAPVDAQPSSVGAVRLLIGGLALMVLAVTRGVFRRARTEPSRSGTRWPILATVFAAGGVAAYQPFFFSSVARTGVAVGTMVAIGSSPILAGLLGFLIHKERFGLAWAVSTALAVMGCILLLSPGSAVSVDPFGFVLALSAGASYAAYAVASKRLLEANPPDAVMAVVFCLGAVFLSPLLFTHSLVWLVQLHGLAVALHLGLVATAAAYVLFARGLMLIPVASAVTLSLAEPLIAGTLGIVVLGERLTTTALLGVVLIFTGLALLTFSPPR